MKTTLLIVRHGESIGNQRGLFLGHTDLGLTELGIRQARALARGLAGRRIDAVYSSDLCRAVATVTPAAEERGLPIVPRRELREIYAGAWEGQSYDTLIERWPRERHIWKTDIGHACPPGGESVAGLFLRVAAAFDEIAAGNPGKTVLVGTHATPVRATVARLLGLGAAGMASIPWAPNASITTVVYEGGTPTLGDEDGTAHLDGIRSDVSGKI